MEPSSKVPPASRSASAGSSQSAGRDGIGLGQRDGGEDLAGVGVEHQARGAGCRVAQRGLLQFFGQSVLHADIERKAHGLGRHSPRPLHGLHAAGLVEHALEAGEALVVGVDGADQVAGERAQRVGALELGAEGEAGEAEVVHALGLAGAEAAGDPHEAAALVGERFLEVGGVEAGERGAELLQGLVEVEDEQRVGVERMHGDVGGDEAAGAVDDVGTRKGTGERLGHGDPDLGRRPGGEAHELAGDGGEADERGEERHHRAPAET